MPVPTHAVNVVSLVLCLSLLALQNGCSNSGSGDAQAPATNPAATLSLALTTTNGVTAIVADGQSTVPIRMTVANGVGTPMPGVSVTFATTDGTLSPSPVVRVAQGLSRTDLDAVSRANGNSLTVSTDTNGIAQVLLTASTTAGVAIVTADVQGFRVHVDIAFAAGPAARVQLDTSISTVSAGGTATLTATVTDTNGNRVPGETVMFTFSTNTSGASFNSNGASFSSLSGVTDANGQATVQYTAGTTAGADTIRVVATSTGVIGSTSITVTAPSGGAVSSAITSISVANGATSPVIANGVDTVAVRATVQGASGPLSSIPVTFSTTAGSFAASATTATATTNASGIATVNLIAPTSSGTATVTASASGFSASTTITFVAGAAAVVQLVANPTTVNPNATSSITARVTDAQGNPVSGQTITFTAPSRGTLSALTGITDANGQFAVTYTAGATPATDTIQVRTVNGITGTLSITITPPAGASRIDLFVSSPQLGSNGIGSVTLTALVRDAANNVASGVLVSFAADSGGIQVTNGTTGAAGTATALLTTGGDQRNRTINVTATTGNLSSRNTVQITGTTLSISGASSIVLGVSTRFSIILRDSGGTGIANQFITVSSALGNPLSATTITTDITGQTTVDVTGLLPGNDMIQVSGLGVTATTTLLISAANFLLTVPASATQVPLNTLQPVDVHWDQGGVPQVSQVINFFATRGNFTTTSVCPAVVVPTISATTDANGDTTTVNICSDNAGPAVISAAANVSAGPSSQVGIEFVATTVASLILQASPTTIGANVSGGSTQQSVITAVVRDARANLVKNQTVSFSLSDVSGGQIFPASAVTDSFGRASTVYTAGAAPSAHNGVLITAAVGAVTNIVTLTVTQQPLFVVLGTGNLINSPSSTQYALPYSILVTDANGNPVANAPVQLSVLPTRYQKGFYALFFNAGACTGWGKVLSIQGNIDPDDADQACQNEDSNFNGILDPGEDHNSNGILDPGNVATVPGTVTTDVSGFAFFDVVYAKEFTWVVVDLEARTVVAGSEGLSRAQFFLSGAAADFTNCSVPPPGQVSPYGISQTCACDERTIQFGLPVLHQ